MGRRKGSTSARAALRAALACLACLWALAPALAQDGNEGPPGTYFPVAELNPGLGRTPDWVDLDTPQGAVESFLDAIDRGDLGAAAHVLDLNAFAPAQQAQRGPELAAQLAAVLRRRAVISWRALMERPDALDARQSSSAAMAGEPRRSILIGVLDEGAREAAIRLNRIRPEGGPPAWVFSARTVEQIEPLYDRYGPTALERALPGWVKEPGALGFSLWTAIGIPTILALAWATGWLTWRLFHWLCGRATRYWTTAALTALRWPLILVASTTMILFLTLKVFALSGAVASVLTPAILVGYVVAVMMFGMSALDTALNRMVTLDSGRLADPANSRVRTQATLMTAARRAVIVVGVIAGVGIVLSSANLYRSLGFSLLASAGALTLVLGFAARHVLGNILASLQISMNRSARIGDQVVFEGKFMTVERIHFTYIQLKTMKDNRLVVPVSTFVQDKFENWSMEDAGMTCHVPMTFAQTADLDTMELRFHDLVREEPLIPDKGSATMWVMAQGPLGVDVRFQFRVEKAVETWTTERRMQRRIQRAAQEEEAASGRVVLPRIPADGGA